MADPEQIYQEVLAEEQAKGSASPVAEGRAKAARQRAVHGSPHPKEPKWWPGSQPQFEGGDGAAPAAEETEEVEEAQEAPAAEEAAPAPAAEEQPAAAAPPAETVAEPEVLTRDQPEAPTPAAQPAAATAPVAPAATVATPEAPPVQRPTGVTHGTPSGNRLRPEDAVSTEVQFDAQEALRQRRKMIDELVASGVPAVSARSRERRSGGVGMLLLYLLIPLLAIGFLVSNQDDLSAGGAEGGEVVEGEGQGEGGELTISAANVQFDKDELTIPADGAPLHFVNEDTVEHNVSIYQSDAADEDIFVGEIIPGDQEITYELPAEEPGEYYFQCDVHPAMNGVAIYE